MNTNTNRFTHRHAVAVPLLASVLLSIGAGGSGFVASAISAPTSEDNRTIDAGAEDTFFAFQNGTYGSVSAGGHLQKTGGSVELVDGGALIASEGVLWMKAGDVSLLGFRGGAYVHRRDDELTVSAISTPVLLRKGGFVSLITQGHQGTWSMSALPSSRDHVQTVSLFDDLHALDDDFHRSELQNLQRMQVTAEEGSAAKQIAAFAESFDPLAMFRLPMAAERREAATLEQSINEIARLIEAGDSAALHTLLSREEVSQFLRSSPEMASRMPELLSEAAKRPGMVLELLPLASDPDLQLLASLHQDLRSAAWLSGAPRVSDETDIARLRILLLPLADTLSEASADIVVRRWGDALATELQTAEDPSAVMAELFPSFDRFVTTAVRFGYPDRLGRYLGELGRVVDANPDLLTANQRAELDAWTLLISIPLDDVVLPEPDADAEVTADESASSSENSSSSVASQTEGASLDEILNTFGSGAAETERSSVAPADKEAAQAQTRAALQEAGALFTVRTVIEALGNDRVAVSGVVFTSPDGTHLYEFEFQPSTRQLSQIYKDGQKQLFGMDMGGFTKWIGE